MYVRIVAASLLLTVSASAQNAEPALLPKALEIIATQRNQALGDAAIWQAKAMLLADELAKAQAKIKELEPKPELEKKP